MSAVPSDVPTPRRFATNYLYVAGLVFVATGLTFVIAPGLVVAISEHAGASADALNDVRTIYGAFELALGLFLIVCARRVAWTEAGLALAVLVGGLGALSRIGGFVLVSGTPPAHLGYAALDVVGAVLAGYAMRRAA
jgi:hypothetical protein